MFDWLVNEKCESFIWRYFYRLRATMTRTLYYWEKSQKGLTKHFPFTSVLLLSISFLTPFFV